MKKYSPSSRAALYKEKSCPICHKPFSIDWKTCFQITRICLCNLCTHIAQDHLSQVHLHIKHYPRELERLKDAKDGPSWLAILYYLASYIGHSRAHRFVINSLEVLQLTNDSRSREA